MGQKLKNRKAAFFLGNWRPKISPQDSVFQFFSFWPKISPQDSVFQFFSFWPEISPQDSVFQFSSRRVVDPSGKTQAVSLTRSESCSPSN